MTPILTITVNPTVDIGLEVDRLLPTGKTRARRHGETGGGGGINVARVVIELGGEVVALHTAGGETGARLDRLLDEEGLDHRSLAVEGETREAILLSETETDRSYHVVPAGPELSAEVGRRLLELVTEQARDHELVVVSGSVPAGLPDDIYAALARVVREAGGRLVLDSSGAALRRALKEGVYVVKPNRREAAEILGRELDGFDDACELNDRLLSERAAEIVATTLGELGAVVSADGSHSLVRTPPLPHPARSDAGAGDSFVAGMALSLARGMAPGEAGRWAVAAAAATVLTPGTQLCRRSDVEELWSQVEVSQP